MQQQRKVSEESLLREFAVRQGVGLSVDVQAEHAVDRPLHGHRGGDAFLVIEHLVAVGDPRERRGRLRLVRGQVLRLDEGAEA